MGVVLPLSNPWSLPTRAVPLLAAGSLWAITACGPGSKGETGTRPGNGEASDDGSAEQSSEAGTHPSDGGASLDPGLDTGLDTGSAEQASDSANADAGDEGDEGDAGDGELPKFDIGVDDMVDPNQEDFSFIWVANTMEGTLSKINTRTVTEIARYRTGPAGQDLQPSRTSVNLQGDAVVANRGTGTVVKFAARRSDCLDRDGDGQIQTSGGPNEVLDWQADECMLWSTNPGFTGGGGGSRGLAWDFAEDASGDADPRVWVGFRNNPDQGHVVRLNGKTGAVEDDVVVDGWLEIYSQGIYGGAIAPNGDFWAIGKGGSMLHVTSDAASQRRWQFDPPANWPETFYGMTMDAQARLWVGGQSGELYRFDTATETMTTLARVGPQKLFGIALDAEGVAWIAAQSPCELKRFDAVNDVLLDSVALPACRTPVGTSIDFDGYAWVVDKDAGRAYRVHPVDLTVEVVTGLVTPYTYSDMTGGALKSVIPPSRAR